MVHHPRRVGVTRTCGGILVEMFVENIMSWENSRDDTIMVYDFVIAFSGGLSQAAWDIAGQSVTLKHWLSFSKGLVSGICRFERFTNGNLKFGLFC